jgi:hypothetical protein
MTLRSTRRPREDGQALVLMVGGIAVVLAVVALIIDGGNAWANQRIVQNGSDASAEAGAVVMASRMAGVTTPGGGWDALVNTRVLANAAANGITVTAAYYTDICGIPLRAGGTAALNPDGTEDLSTASQVGFGIPSSVATTVDCPSLNVGPPAGVLVFGQKNVGTYLAGIVGVTSLMVNTRATAVAGYLQGYCDASQGTVCALLPVAIPVNILTCDGNNDPVNTQTPWLLGPIYKIPLCANGPGNVGWLDWTPKAGGTSELIDSILTADNPAINLPSWQYVAETGNVNSQGVEDAIRTWDGEVVMIPMFDLTCSGLSGDPDNTLPALITPDDFGCAPGDVGGNGQNQWYRVPSFAYFELCNSSSTDCLDVGATHGAYVNGQDGAICDTGNGATSCLVGKFVRILATGTVGPGVGGGDGNLKTIGVQLIK